MRNKLFKSHGFSLIEMSVATGLIGILVFFGVQIMTMIGQQRGELERQSQVPEVLQELQVLMGDPGNCTCNLRGRPFKGPLALLSLNEMSLYGKPGEVGNVSCEDKRVVLIKGQKFSKTDDNTSSVRIEKIGVGPFIPLGNEGYHLASINVASSTGEGPLKKPSGFQFMVQVRLKQRSDGLTEVDQCAEGIPNRDGGGRQYPNPTAPLSGRMYRFSEIAVYKNCSPTHFATIKGIRASRNDYLWPVEYGNIFNPAISQGVPLAWYNTSVVNTDCFAGKHDIPGIYKLKLLGHPQNYLSVCPTLLNRYKNGPPFEVSYMGHRVSYPCDP